MVSRWTIYSGLSFENHSAVFRINLYADSRENKILLVTAQVKRTAQRWLLIPIFKGIALFTLDFFVGNAFIRQGTMIFFYLTIKPSLDYEEVQNCLNNFIIYAQARCKFLSRMQLLWKIKHSYLNISWVSKSISSPLMNRAESPGCSPNVPLKYWKEVESH